MFSTYFGGPESVPGGILRFRRDTEAVRLGKNGGKTVDFGVCFHCVGSHFPEGKRLRWPPIHAFRFTKARRIDFRCYFDDGVPL